MRNKQAGGIVSFIIVAVALAGLLAGGLYLSKQQGRAARENDTSTPQVSTTDTREKTDEKKNESGAERDEAQQAPHGNSEARQEQSRPATNDAPSGGVTTPNNGSTRTDRVVVTEQRAVDVGGHQPGYVAHQRDSSRSR